AVDTLHNGSLATIPAPIASLSPDNVLNVEEVWSYVIPYDITQPMIDGNIEFLNTVDVTATGITTPVSDDAMTRVVHYRSMLIDKQVDQDRLDAPGVLSYTITISNAGNIALTGVTPVDVLDGVITALPAPTGDG